MIDVDRYHVALMERYGRELPQPTLTRNGSVSAEMVAFVRGSGMRRPSDVICSLKPSASGDDACYL